MPKLLVPRPGTHKEKLAAAEREAQAQLDIIRALNPLDSDGVERVMKAVMHLIEADNLMPGLLGAVATGLARGKKAAT